MPSESACLWAVRKSGISSFWALCRPHRLTEGFMQPAVTLPFCSVRRSSQASPKATPRQDPKARMSSRTPVVHARGSAAGVSGACRGEMRPMTLLAVRPRARRPPVRQKLDFMPLPLRSSVISGREWRTCCQVPPKSTPGYTTLIKR
jgi:hypothetical protein